MIGLKRIVDNKIMNDRAANDWQKHQQLADVQAAFDAFDENTAPDVIARVQAAIDRLTADRDAWHERRKAACAKMCGGVASDYEVFQIPSGQEHSFFTCRYAEFDGETLICDTSPEYGIDGSAITVNPGWVKLNYRLASADVTDFSGLTLTEPLYFRLVYAQNQDDQSIVVKLLTRNEEEEFGTMPAGLTLLRTIYEGRVNIYNIIGGV